MRYVGRPIDVEAMQWDPMHEPWLGHEAIVAWVNASGGEARYEPGHPMDGGNDWFPARIAVRTINGWAYAAPGHYIVMGSETFPTRNGKPYYDRRDFYPCDPVTFEKRWEPKP